MKYHNNCPICNSKNLISLKKYEKHHLIKCLECSFVFCKPIPTQEKLQSYYYNYSYDSDYYISPVTVKRYKEILREFEKYRKYNRILEIGCGIGIFLSIAKEMGWECYGTEYSTKAVELCRSKGLTVFQGSIAEIKNQLPVVDIVVLIEVIEHVSFPNFEIEQINQLLRKEGALYITTPNFNSISRYLLKDKYNVLAYPEHLCYFTVSTLSHLMLKNDFIIKKIKTTGFSVNRIQSTISFKRKNPFQHNSIDEKIRLKTENKWWLLIIKQIINFFLNMTRLGDSLKGLFEKK